MGERCPSCGSVLVGFLPEWSEVGQAVVDAAMALYRSSRTQVPAALDLDYKKIIELMDVCRAAEDSLYDGMEEDVRRRAAEEVERG